MKTEDSSQNSKNKAKLVRKIFLPVAENKKGKKVLILAHEKY
jgi:hypothetical protein